MKHEYELRAWHNDDTMTTVLKINDEPKNAKQKAKEYAKEHEGVYLLCKVEDVEIYLH